MVQELGMVWKKSSLPLQTGEHQYSHPKGKPAKELAKKEQMGKMKLELFPWIFTYWKKRLLVAHKHLHLFC